MSFGQRPDQAARFGAHATRDEPLDSATIVDDPERRILRANHGPDLVDDDLEDIVDRRQLGDRPDGGVEGSLNLARAIGRGAFGLYCHETILATGHRPGWCRPARIERSTGHWPPRATGPTIRA